ncbi:MAG: hypothetical protein IJY23_00370 [Clostridia bacterium]|nr:hypothetical protein [Clostridia bacterium]
MKKYLGKCIACVTLLFVIVISASCADKTTHDFSNWQETSPTCSEFGTKSRKCSICGMEEIIKTAPLGHTLVGDSCSVCGRDDFLVLIESGKADFTVVYTSFSGGAAKKVAENFVAFLRERGVEVGDPISDLDDPIGSKKEIIIGANCRNREGCSISDKYIGVDGISIKTVGNRLIIASGQNKPIKNVFWDFLDDNFEINDSTEKIPYLEIGDTYCYEELTRYDITSLKIGNTLLSEFKLVTDIMALRDFKTSNIVNFRKQIYDKTGYWLEQGTIESINSYEHSFIIRYNDSIEDSFKAYTSGGNFIIECDHAVLFDEMFAKFTAEYIFGKMGEVEFGSDFLYEKTAGVVRYEDFGAVGDGVACDFTAIYNAHTYANKYGFRVEGKAGATYYISPEKFTKSVSIMTDTNFMGATFIVDDRGDAAYKYKGRKLFTVKRDSTITYTDSDGDGVIDDERFASVTIELGDTKFEWLEGVLKEKSVVRVLSTKHKDFIRHGANQSSGEKRQDVFVVETDGTISEDTPVIFEFNNGITVSELHIYSADDNPITVERGTFINICCTTVAETDYKSKYRSYNRGFEINRPNVTISNITHKMQDEPEFGYSHELSGYTADSLHSKYGSRCESYPYYGFFYIMGTYNLNITDCEITGHTTYYEDKAATTSTGGAVPNPVPMGSYDYVIDRSVNVTFTRVIQSSPTGLGDSRYWGIMSSNGTKNMTFDSCEVNRIDAHRGFHNATLIDTTVGHTISLIGSGTFRMVRSTKLVGSNLISLRSDYGATFDGDIILEDCTHEAYKTYNTSTGGRMSTARYSDSTIIQSGYSTSNSGYSNGNTDGAYWMWYFGYTSYMPRNVIVDNYTSGASNVYLFNDLPDKIFTATYVEGETPTKNTVRYPYVLTESVTYKNMAKSIPVCKSTSCTKLRSIPITEINIGTSQ